jgi:hypothetical protein
MKLTYFPNHAARNAGAVLDAWVAGCVRHGMTIAPNDCSADVAVLWSQLWAGRMRPNQDIFQQFRSTGRPVIILDAGCIRRNHTWRVLPVGHAWFAGQAHDELRRRALGIDLRDWHTGGNKVIIALQRPDSNQWHGMPPTETWLARIIDQVRQHTDRMIEVRPHPRFDLRQKIAGVTVQQPRRVPQTYDDFDFVQNLAQAWCVINWNSTPGTVSVCHGVPAFVGASSLAAPVANLDLAQIENPRRPDREQWANDLAWTEWTVPEMAQGTPQGLLLDYLRHH